MRLLLVGTVLLPALASAADNCTITVGAHAAHAAYAGAFAPTVEAAQMLRRSAAFRAGCTTGTAADVVCEHWALSLQGFRPARCEVEFE